MLDFRSMSQLTERIIHKYTQAEKQKRYYGSDILLTRAEIHTIEAVGNQQGINVTTLAKKLGITKGATSQMIYKLVDKGMVVKTVSPNSDTEVCLNLTSAGTVAFEEHRRYHAEHDSKFFSQVKGIPDEILERIICLMEDFEKELDEKLKK
ncbi:MAG: MarR family transcriptional regulator [Lachnospiraceae bacterium]|nr:MarR family transcriptional regulator [Lachnospiraceae bacterium]